MTAVLSAAALQRHAERARLDNEDRLDGCDTPHVFAVLHSSGGFGVRKSRWRCTLCDGVVDGLARRWYDAGLHDGAVERPAMNRPLSKRTTAS